MFLIVSSTYAKNVEQWHGTWTLSYVCMGTVTIIYNRFGYFKP